MAFLFRGIFLVAIFPIFRGQDEARHYNTIQYLASNKKQDCLEGIKKENLSKQQNKQDLSTYRYSDEIRKTALVSQNKQIRGNYYDKIIFTNSLDGLGEEKFKQQHHSKVQHICPPDIATSMFNKDSLGIYHKFLKYLESALTNQNIFVRYNILRIISVLMGVLFLYLAYQTFLAVGLSKKQSLILTTVISFQPKLAIYFTNINYDIFLIPIWTGFVLLSVRILKSGWSIWRGLGLLTLFVLGVKTKPTAVALLGLVIYLIIYSLWRSRKRIKHSKLLLGVAVAVSILGVYFVSRRVDVLTLFATDSFGLYLTKSFSKIYGSSRDYWGVLGWQANNLTLVYVKIIWFIEWVAWLGLAIFAICPWLAEAWSLQACRDRVSAKVFAKYFWFMLASIVALQVGIRVADWKVFAESGSLVLGTPGRYWLPNIVPHFVLLTMGLKVITGFFRSKRLQKKYFESSLLVLLVIMILYWSYEVFDVIIPRFYL